MKILFIKIFFRVFLTFSPTFYIMKHYEKLNSKSKFYGNVKEKFQKAILCNPEIHQYFGEIKEISFINLKIPKETTKDFSKDYNAEYLILGSKNYSKVFIRFVFMEPNSLSSMVEKQRELYEKYLLEKKLMKKDALEKYFYDEFNKINILFISQLFWKKWPTSLEEKIPENPIEAKEAKEIKELKELKKYLTSNLSYCPFSFNFENQGDSVSFTNRSKYIFDKLKQTQKDIKINKPHNKDLKSPDISNESLIIDDNFSLALKSFLGFAENKIKNKDSNDIFVKDIMIKKNLQFYSLSQNSYNSKEYSKIDSYLSLENYQSGTKLDDIENEYTNRNIESAVRKYFNYKINQSFYKKTIENYNNKNSLSTKHKNQIDDEFEYSYSAIDELIDYIKFDHRVSYFVKVIPFCLFSFIVYSLIFNGHKNMNQQLIVKNIGINSEMNNLLKAPYYFRSKSIFNTHDIQKLVFIQHESANKKVILMNVNMNTHQGIHKNIRIYDEGNVKI
jgi:hypothetical protein